MSRLYVREPNKLLRIGFSQLKPWKLAARFWFLNELPLKSTLGFGGQEAFQIHQLLFEAQ